MYGRRSNFRPIIITAIVMAAAVGVLIAVNLLAKKPKQPKETEAAKKSVLIYKSTDGSVEYDKDLLDNETDTDLLLNVQPTEMVTLIVHPITGKYFDSLSINATGDISESYSYLVNDADGDNKRINFVMPDADVIVNLKFTDKETEVKQPTQETKSLDTEADEMVETPETNPYGLTIHGLTASILQSYNGQFDDQSFLQQLGDQLHISSVKSEYQGVTDVTFSEKEYQGEKDEDKVYHYIYFNNDPRWEALASYYTKDKTYLFTEVEPESETSQSETADPNSASQQDSGNAAGAGSSGSYSSGGSSSGNGYTGGSFYTTPEGTTSFDIMQVSTVFLKYVGGQDRFYSEAFNYVLKKGMTGEIVGTMSSYEISTDENKATFSISLSTGGSISGTYSKTDDAFTFEGP